ncbi:MAG: hypothetical protein PVF37_18200 [Desulfobacterales bacterium]
MPKKVEDITAATKKELIQLFTYRYLDMICRRLNEIQRALTPDVILTCDSCRPTYGIPYHYIGAKDNLTPALIEALTL